jgi:DeoR/GlpR family transcriptional regulator of sugar metabolism
VAAELSVRLDVSEDTVRRDLRELAKAGVLRRVHGGALPRSPSDPRYAVRQQESPLAKVAIAKAAADMVCDGQVVIMDAGTTTLQVAQHLSHDLKATVVTNSPPVAIALGEHPNLEVIVVGGHLYKVSMANVGAGTVQELSAIHADLCFLGVGGIHPDAGLSILSSEEVYTKRAMIDGAAKVVAVAAGEKLATVGPFVVAPVSDLTHIVTEEEAPEEAVAPYRKLGIAIVKA